MGPEWGRGCCGTSSAAKLVDMKAPFRTAVTVLLFPLLALSACAPGPGNQPGSPAASPSTEPASSIELTIVLTESPDAAPHTFRLVSHGPSPDPSSTLPDPVAALAAVELDDGKILFPVPDPRRACTQQYGGPETAVVTGSYKGRAVNTSFKRTDGCEIARWQAAAALLGGLGGGSGAI